MVVLFQIINEQLACLGYASSVSMFTVAVNQTDICQNIFAEIVSCEDSSRQVSLLFVEQQIHSGSLRSEKEWNLKVVPVDMISLWQNEDLNREWKLQSDLWKFCGSIQVKEKP